MRVSFFSLRLHWAMRTRSRGEDIGDYLYLVDGGGGACLPVSGEGGERQKGDEGERVDHAVRRCMKLLSCSPSAKRGREGRAAGDGCCKG